MLISQCALDANGSVHWITLPAAVQISLIGTHVVVQYKPSAAPGQTKDNTELILLELGSRCSAHFLNSMVSRLRGLDFKR